MGLFCFSDDYNGRACNWIPKHLPKHVHVVLSTLPDEKYQSMSALRQSMPDTENQFIEIPDLLLQDAAVILNHWLVSSSHMLSQEQLDHILEVFSQNPQYLYLRLIYRDSINWVSASTLPNFSKSLKSVILVLFAKLENSHGEQLTRRSLGYLTASKHGLTDSEMEDVLSLDEHVMDELHGKLMLTLRRCPSFAWLRLRHALGDLLMELVAGDYRPLRWSQTLVEEAARERYHTPKDIQNYHKILAEYFEGKWAQGRKKPYGGNDVGRDRLVIDQSLYHTCVDSDAKLTQCNTRHLNELPVHLLKSGNFDELKSKCLCNFDFLKVKLAAFSLRSILDDIQTALTAEPKDADLNILYDVLYLSRHEVIANPRQLATQLLGRLTDIIRADTPRAPSDPRRYPFLNRLVNAARRHELPVLVPSRSCMAPPGGILNDCLQGHDKPITAIQLTKDSTKAITASLDNTVKIWDLKYGRVTKTIPDVGAKVCYMCLPMQDAMLVTSEMNCIRVWSMKNGICLFHLKDVNEPAPIVSVGDGSVLAAFHDGTCLMRSWNLKTMAPLCESQLSSQGMHQNKCIVVSKNCHGDNVLYALRGSSTANVINCRAGTETTKLNCSLNGSCITCVEMTKDYFLLGLKKQSPKFANKDIFYIEVFEKSGSHVRNIKGCEHDNVTDLLINSIGSHAVTVNCDFVLGKSDIAMWNLETEEHKHGLQHAHLSTMAVMRDFRCLLTGHAKENTLFIWNLQDVLTQAGNKKEDRSDIAYMKTMAGNSKYVITRSFGNQNVTIWNVSMNKCQGKAVQV